MSKNIKRKIKDTFETIIILLPLILVILIAVGYCVLSIYCFINYGDTPVSELPAWVWWVMHSGGGGK